MKAEIDRNWVYKSTSIFFHGGLSEDVTSMLKCLAKHFPEEAIYSIGAMQHLLLHFVSEVLYSCAGMLELWRSHWIAFQAQQDTSGHTCVLRNFSLFQDLQQVLHLDQSYRTIMNYIWCTYIKYIELHCLCSNISHYLLYCLCTTSADTCHNPVTMLTFCILLILLLYIYIYRFLYAVLLSLFFAVPSTGHLLDSGLGCQSSQEAKNCCRWCCRDFGSKSLPGVYSSASSSSMTYHTDLLKFWWESSWKATQNLLMGRSWTQCQQWSRLRSFPQRRAFSHKPIAEREP